MGQPRIEVGASPGPRAASVGRRAERLAGRVADPARQPRRGGGDLQLGLADAVVDRRDHRARREHLGLRAAPAAVGGVGGVDLQARPRRAARAARRACARWKWRSSQAIAVSRRRLASASRRAASAASASRSKRAERARRLSPRVSSCITATERMVIARVVSIRPADRQVGDAGLQRRVGPLAGGDGHLARRGCAGVLRHQLLRSLLAPVAAHARASASGWA